MTGWEGEDTGTLTCVVCGKTYPVFEGIPRLLPKALEGDAATDHESGEKRREMAARDAQAAHYDKMLALRLFSLLEIPLTLHYLAPEREHLLLEAGCGTGRMTSAFADRVRGLVSVDFSRESLRAAREKLPPSLREKVLFLQADISHLPLRSDAFDRVGSFQVLEHLPTAEARGRAVSELSRVAKGRQAGGRLALSVYRWGPPVSYLARKQGHHEGGIPYYRATWEELSALLSPTLSVSRRTGALLYHYLVQARRHI